MEKEKKWIFIEKSTETVRYKVGDSDSSMESQDFEYLSPKDSPPVLTYEIIPSKTEPHHSDEEIEIHDDHFSSYPANEISSCPTSEMEDSDIEVVVKSPSTSETVSLCSLNSQKSIPNDIVNYEDMIFNLDTSEKVECDNEEEDSEVEVISRSIHRNGSFEMSYLEQLDDDSLDSSLSSVCSSIDGNEIGGDVEDEPEEITLVKRKTSSTHVEEGGESTQDLVVTSTTTNGGEHVECLEDIGIKYLLEDLHVSRQINGRLVGLKTSTLALTVCLSITLGVYLGNYMNPTGISQHIENDAEEDQLLVPEDVIHSTSGDPLKVNITFKYSSSTKESLRSVLRSFQKLRNDYDRLHAVYADVKERCSLKRQMTFYWRKQVEKHNDGENTRNDSVVEGQPIESLLTNTGENMLSDVYNNTLQSQQRTIWRLSRDLKVERRSSMYWRKRYNDIEHTNANTCSRHEAPAPPSFSFSDCLHLFSNVIPSLDLTGINITNRAENLADRVQNAWSRLRSRWDAKKVQRDDPLYAGKVNRFLKIFTISNVVNSDNHGLNRSNIVPLPHIDPPSPDVDAVYYPWINDPPHDVTICPCDDPYYPHNACVNIPCDVDSNVTHDYIVSQSFSSRIGDRSTEFAKVHNGSEVTDRLQGDHVMLSRCMDETKWYRHSYHKSNFLFHVLKWRDVYREKTDFVKSRHIARLVNENEKQFQQIEVLSHFEEENNRLMESIKRNEEVVRNKTNNLVSAEKENCRLLVENITNTMRDSCSDSMNDLQANVSKSEKSKYNKRIRILLNLERRRYDRSMKEARRTTKRKEKAKCQKKMRSVKESFRREKKKYKAHYKRKKRRFHEKQGMNDATHDGEKKRRRPDSKKPHKQKNRASKKNHPGKHYYHNDNKYDISKNKDENEAREKQYRKNGKHYQNTNKNNKYSHRRKYRRKQNHRVSQNNMRERLLLTKVSNYRSKHKQSAIEASRLRKMNDEASKLTRLQEETIKSYEEKLQRYKDIVEEYEDKMNEVRKGEIIRNSFTHETLKKYNRVIKENARLKRSISTLTGESSEKETLYVDIDNSENAEEDIDTTNGSDVQIDYILDMSGGKCSRDRVRKPFYNIEDVFPTDLFSRAISKSPPAPSKPVSLQMPGAPRVSSAISDEAEHFLVPNNRHEENRLFASPGFSEEVIFSATNESLRDIEEVEVFWDNVDIEMNEHSHSSEEAHIHIDEERVERNENSHKSQPADNWYMNRIQEREQIRRSGLSENMESNRKEFFYWSSASEKEGNDVNWFWKAMKERENIRTNKPDINWFWILMKEREKLRSSEGNEGWFWNLMKEREKLRTSGEDDDD